MRVFPTTRSDGSFSIRATFQAGPKDDVTSVQSWLSQWIEQNSEWEFFGNVHPYLTYFFEIPKVSLASSGALRVSFHGISDERRMWKDWMVRILRELEVNFPEIGELSGNVEDDALYLAKVEP
jgi:hypothetical protein